MPFLEAVLIPSRQCIKSWMQVIWRGWMEYPDESYTFRSCTPNPTVIGGNKLPQIKKALRGAPKATQSHWLSTLVRESPKLSLSE